MRCYYWGAVWLNRKNVHNIHTELLPVLHSDTDLLIDYMLDLGKTLTSLNFITHLQSWDIIIPALWGYEALYFHFTAGLQ